MALERDGALYDVEALERDAGVRLERASLGGVGLDGVGVDGVAFERGAGNAWDFHTRVVSLGLMGLAELDRLLLKGLRPTEARIGPTGFAILAPLDTERASYVHFDTTTQRVHIGHAPSIAGQDALVDPVGDDEPPDFEVGVGIVLGDDLRNASRGEAKHAIAGASVLIDWRGARTGSRGLRAQLGPVLVPTTALGSLGRLNVRATIGARQVSMGTLTDLGILPEEAVARISYEVPLRAGDLVGLGPLPGGSPRRHGVELEMHDSVAVMIDRIGTLRGIPVPRRSHVRE